MNAYYLITYLILSRYENHPSIVKIRENVQIKDKFVFKDVTSSQIKHEIDRINPAKILMSNSDILCEYLANIYNNSKNKQNYPISMKKADVIPVYKPNEKNEKVYKRNYKPVSLTPIVAKVFERNMFNELSLYINKFLSSYLLWYRKGHSTEQCLATMIEFWRKALNNKNSVGAVLTDLSNAFDSLNHNLLIAKLAAYDFENGVLGFIYDNLQKEKTMYEGLAMLQFLERIEMWGTTRINSRSLTFNIFINDIYFFINKIILANYADDTSVYSKEDNSTRLLDLLQTETLVVLNWFRKNEMKSNDDKCHLIIANNEEISLNLEHDIIRSSENFPPN